MSTARTVHFSVLQGAFALGLFAVVSSMPARAGGNLEVFDFTNAPPSPIVTASQRFRLSASLMSPASTAHSMPLE